MAERKGLEHRAKERWIDWPGMPQFTMRVHSSVDQHVSEAICRYGCWEPFTSAVMRRLLRRGETMVDVGANIGWYTILAARAVGINGAVLALEPDPANRLLLKHNLLAAGVGNVCSEPFAASDSNSPGFLFRSPDNLGDHRIFASPGVGSPIPIETRRLDHLLAQTGPVALFKVDVQGAEQRVLEGLGNRLLTDRPVLFVEFWPFGIEHSGGSVRGLLELLEATRLEWYLVDEAAQLVRPTSKEMLAARAVTDLEPATGRHVDLLLLPEGRATRIEPVLTTDGARSIF